MAGVISGITINILAAGLMKSSAEGYQEIQRFSRQHEFSADIDDIETEFQRALKAAINECEVNELTEAIEQWDEIVICLYQRAQEDEIAPGTVGATDRLVFEDKADAIKRISHAIATVAGYELAERPHLQRELRGAVTTAYRATMMEFLRRLDEANLLDRFLGETAIENRAELTELQNELQQLKQQFTQPDFYDLYKGTPGGRLRTRLAIDPRPFDIGMRPELAGCCDSERLLMLGPRGSATSHALAELVETTDLEVEHIIVPRQPLQSTQDLQPLQNEPFVGNVLLIWDDIHVISPETNNRVFRKAVDELADRLAPTHDLYVFATARPDQAAALPGDINDPDSRLWPAFDIVDLKRFDTTALGGVLDRVLAHEEMTAAETVRNMLVQQAVETDRPIWYMTWVVETADGERLARTDVEAAPADATNDLTTFIEQYDPPTTNTASKQHDPFTTDPIPEETAETHAASVRDPFTLTDEELENEQPRGGMGEKSFFDRVTRLIVRAGRIRKTDIRKYLQIETTLLKYELLAFPLCSISIFICNIFAALLIISFESIDIMLSDGLTTVIGIITMVLLPSVIVGYYGIRSHRTVLERVDDSHHLGSIFFIPTSIIIITSLQIFSIGDISGSWWTYPLLVSTVCTVLLRVIAVDHLGEPDQSSGLIAAGIGLFPTVLLFSLVLYGVILNEPWMSDIIEWKRFLSSFGFPTAPYILVVYILGIAAIYGLRQPIISQLVQLYQRGLSRLVRYRIAIERGLSSLRRSS